MTEQASIPLPSAELPVYAGFWRRLSALFIDCVVLVVVTLLFMGFEDKTVEILSTIFAMVYSIGMHARFGATLGKMAMKMHITKLDGAPINFSIALIRHSPYLLLAIASILLGQNDEYITSGENPAVLVVWLVHLLFLLASAAVLIANPQKRTIHDMIAGTVVKNKHPAVEAK